MIQFVANGNSVPSHGYFVVIYSRRSLEINATTRNELPSRLLTNVFSFFCCWLSAYVPEIWRIYDTEPFPVTSRGETGRDDGSGVAGGGRGRIGVEKADEKNSTFLVLCLGAIARYNRVF